MNLRKSLTETSFSSHKPSYLLFGVFSCVVFCFLLNQKEAKAFQPNKKGIVKGATMRIAGKYKFSVTKNARSSDVSWTIDREETDEKGESTLTLIKNVGSAKGKEATFDLPKTAGKETIYHINAVGKDFQDSLKIKVFEPNRPSSFVYKSKGNPDVRAFILVPENLNSATRIILVMSGVQRNADEYLNSWTIWASQNNYIAISPNFDEKNWDGSRGYNLGNVFTGDEGKGALNPRSKWSFTIVEGIYQQVRSEFNLSDDQFDIFGHSAGAQFVHRFMLFNPQAKVRTAIAANPGWYTLPDLNHNYSYGLKHPMLSFTKQDLIDWTNRRIIIMRGTADTSREGALRKTPEADAQGQNRFERAAFMFAKIKALNLQTKWQLIDVEGVNHNQQKMAIAAQEFLQKQNKPIQKNNKLSFKF